jgi:hypothetical protein
MSASETVMHQMFSQIVAEYHPFADYLGYQESDDNFMIYYQGSNGQQAMVVDTEGNIIADSTIGTTRTVSLLAVGAAVLSLFFGGQSDR